MKNIHVRCAPLELEIYLHARYSATIPVEVRLFLRKQVLVALKEFSLRALAAEEVENAET